MNRHTFILSTEDVNSYGTWISTEGISLKRFNINPVMFYGHNYDIVIGRWENLRIENGKLLADAVFDMKDPFAAEIARKIEEGFIKGVSVGIDIIAHSDDKQYKKPGQGLPAILQSELVEASIVPVPANSSSLKLGRLAKNLKLSAELSDKYIDLLFENNHTLNQNLNMKQIALKLGLKDDATEQDILSAIEKIQLANKKGIELVKNVIGKIFAKAGFKDEKAIESISKIIDTNMELADDALNMIQLSEPKQQVKQESIADMLRAQKQPEVSKPATFKEFMDQGKLAALKAQNLSEYKRLYHEHYKCECVIED
jgi:HK97 family phage prohead protease